MARFGSTRHLGWIALGLVLATVLAVAGTHYSGRVRGEEFCPASFERRTFSYFEIPLIRQQVSGVRHRDKTGELEAYLAQEKWIAAEKRACPRWDLVVAYRAHIRSRFGEAQILCAYLDALDADGELMWLNWSRRHPTLAGVLWPEVARLADQQLYVLIPRLMTLAEEASDAAVGSWQPARLQEEISRYSAAEFVRLATALGERAQYAAAIELYSEALHHLPAYRPALKGRAGAYTAVGQHALAEQDRARLSSRESTSP